MTGKMNLKRISISIALGFIFGAVCLYGTMNSIPGQLSPPILATIFYDRLLLGLVIGVAGGLPVNPILRGAVLGAAVSLIIAIPSGYIGALLLGAGVVYGVLIDWAATRFS